MDTFSCNGLSDPVTGSGGGEYIGSDVDGGTGNGHFNRYYIVATKHFDTSIGRIGTHLGYQLSNRQDIHYNGPCFAIDYTPVWAIDSYFSLKTIVEYDARTFNVGFIASIWQDRFEAMFELMAMKWINFGLRYKLVLKKL